MRDDDCLEWWQWTWKGVIKAKRRKCFNREGIVELNVARRSGKLMMNVSTGT